MRAKILLLSLCLINVSAQCEQSTQSSLELVREQNNVPALGGLVQHGDAVKIFISGFRKKGDGTRAKVSDKFHLGSNTKVMTATLVAVLVESGKLQWSTKLSEIYPDWSSSMNSKLKNVSIEMLAAHMSGITPDLIAFQNGILLKIAMDPEKSLKKIREETSRLVLAAMPQTEPGSHFEYSNMNYIILGSVLEKVTGLPWEQLMTSMLFEPLQMKSCGFGPPGDVSSSIPDQPWAHRKTSEGINAIPPNSSADNPPALGPAGTVHFSMLDWAKFLRIHRDGFNGLSSKILSAQSFKKLHTPYKGQEYTAGGWLRVERPWADGPVLTSEGSNLGNYATVWIAPRKNMFLLSVANSGDAEEAADKVIQLLIVGERLRL